MISPRSESRLLTDFLNHGLLPFVGRTTELEMLSSFWHAGRESERLRVALLHGEAGVGKSRLIGALAAKIRHGGGVELRATLHPEAANVIAPQLTQALWYSDFGRMLLREEPEGTLSAAIASLRRLARLRPAIVVIEDLHLLGADAVPDLARLLDALADEPLTILCTARPAALASRAALQPYLIEELELRGLGENEIRELWELLLDTPSLPTITRAIAAVTAGNPLAVRSALRCAVRELHAHATIPEDELVASLQRDADLMHEGLVAHLSPELRKNAGHIAHLGEIVSRSAVAAIVADADHTIERLVFAGIVVPLGAAVTPPIAGTAEAVAPLTFTHSLVHHHLAETTPTDIHGIARLLAGDVPVYTLLPFELVADDGDRLADSFELLSMLHIRIHTAMRALDHRGQWSTVRRMLELSDRLVDRAGERLEPEQRLRLDDEVVRDRLSLLRRESGSGRYQLLLDRAMDLTANPTDERQAAARLYTLHFAQLSAVRNDDGDGAIAFGAEINAIVESFPMLVGSVEHVACLGGQAQVAIALNDDAMLEASEREFRELIDSPMITSELRAQLLQRVAPPLLLRFSTPEQLEDRRALLGRIHEAGGFRTPFVETIIAEFLVLSGDFRHALVQARKANRLCTDAGLTMNMVNTRLSLMVAELAIAEPQPAECNARIDAVHDLIASVTDTLRPAYVTVACNRLGEAAWIRLDDEWMRRLLDRLLKDVPAARLGCADAILIGCGSGASSELSAVEELVGESERDLAALRDHLRSGVRDERTIDLAIRLLLTQPASTQDMVHLRASLELLCRHVDGYTPANADRLREIIAAGLGHALEWLASRRLRWAIRSWIERYGSLLEPEQSEAWMRSAGALIDVGFDGFRECDDRLAISMLGEIRFGRGGDTSRLRGVRNRTLLGVMVAIEATGKTLSHSEFCRIATGIEDDVERARKMTNVAVHRLRELLGRETIDTAGESPRLALDAVSIDILQAIAQIDDCERALRAGKPSRAVFAARRALTTLDGEVAWPSLFGPYFEAVRDELEIRLRRALVRVGESLLREGDHDGAEELLRCAVESLPGDDELVELLEEARR